VSLRYRHKYATVLPRGLPSSFHIPPQELPNSVQERVRIASGPDPPGSSRCPFERRNNAGSSRTPLRPARRTRTIWQYWHVPDLSGLLPPSPTPPGSGCPQLRCPAATRSTAKVSHLHSNQQRLTAQTKCGPEPRNADTANREARSRVGSAPRQLSQETGVVSVARWSWMRSCRN
jgi:hypothetical protein